jgi:hypothetical protein
MTLNTITTEQFKTSVQTIKLNDPHLSSYRKNLTILQPSMSHHIWKIEVHAGGTTASASL